MFQQMMDAVIEACREERKRYHVTLGKLLEVTGEADDTTVVKFDVGGSPGRCTTYRGFYHDLALTINPDPRPAGEVHAELSRALGNFFTGYKGGEFKMGPDTPLWMADWGMTGRPIVDIDITPQQITLITIDGD